MFIFTVLQGCEMKDFNGPIKKQFYAHNKFAHWYGQVLYYHILYSINYFYQSGIAQYILFDNINIHHIML